MSERQRNPVMPRVWRPRQTNGPNQGIDDLIKVGGASKDPSKRVLRRSRDRSRPLVPENIEPDRTKTGVAPQRSTSKLKIFEVLVCGMIVAAIVAFGIRMTATKSRGTRMQDPVFFTGAGAVTRGPVQLFGLVSGVSFGRRLFLSIVLHAGSPDPQCDPRGSFFS